MKRDYPVINEGWLPLYTTPMSSLQRQPPPPPVVIVEGEEEYEVAMIHSKKRLRIKIYTWWSGLDTQTRWIGHGNHEQT
jgi:hypothetical protein